MKIQFPFLVLMIWTSHAWAEDLVVVQSGQTFDRTTLAIPTGSHITFANKDDVKHNILVQVQGDDDDDGRDMGLQAPGKNIYVTFDKAGKFLVRCHIHPSMKLDVTVR